MEFRRLTGADDAHYAAALTLYQTSFPLHEQRTSAQQEAVLQHPDYHFTLAVEEKKLCGILLYWQFSGYAYVEHYAIDPDLRGQNLGSRVLSAFSAEQALVILEIDPPIDDISMRREHFYQRLGYHSNPYPHRHPAYRVGNSPHDLLVMSYPQPLTATQYASFARDLETVVMVDCPA